MNSRGEQGQRGDKLDDDETPWMTKEFSGKGCRGWKLVEVIIPAVICGLARRSTRKRCCWMSWTYRTRRWSRISSLCRFLREPQGFPTYGPNLLCSRTCAAEAWPAHPRSLLHDRRARLHLRCTTSVLFLHQRPPICLHVVSCPALVCENEPNRPLAKHFRSHSRTHRFSFARTSRSCNFAFRSTCCDAIWFDLPPPLAERFRSTIADALCDIQVVFKWLLSKRYMVADVELL
jgi:hypothetical protein